MFMEMILTDIAGDTKSIEELREKIKVHLDEGHSVLVRLIQPGVMYQSNGDWFTVVDFMNEWSGDPVSFQSNLVPLAECRASFTYTNDMFFSGPKLYQKNKMCVGLLEKLIPYNEKNAEKHWELLLGQTSENKELLHRLIQSHPVKDKIFMTYFGKDPAKGYWSEHVVQPKKHTGETLSNRFKTQVRCSDLIDPDIYNQTWYSAVVETVVHNDFAMFSGKEAKPIVAKRPFVIFGACGQLEAFRSLGFKTFDAVIDESYDLIKEKQERWQKALDSMFELTKSDPRDVYKKLADVLDHNKKHFENKDWPRCIKWDSYQ